MNPSILRPEVQDFIAIHWNTDPLSVVLQKPLFKEVSQKELAQQLEARKKCRHKLPTWFHTPKLYYPNKLCIEQSSAEPTARYKAELIHGKTLVDITGGLGVDAYYFSQNVSFVHHCEINAELSQIAHHNFKVLGQKNIRCITTDGLEYLQKTPQPFDWVYADPSRRTTHTKRVFRLTESEPNIPQHLLQIFTKTRNVLLKAAPLLDITQGLRELPFVKEIHIVALHNEVKELLFVLEYGYTEAITLQTINIGKSQNMHFAFQLHEEQTTTVAYSAAQNYLYEPNAALLKSGGFKCIGKAFGVSKLHPHSHVYTSSALVNFPGRRFKVLQNKPYSKATMRELGIAKANLTIRNFPLPVAALRKKHNIKDGGVAYLFFTTDIHNDLRVLHCTKM